MAQLAAVAKGLYYPTDLGEVAKLRDNHLHFPTSSYLAFDPCVGEGLALKELTRKANGTAYNEYYRPKLYGCEIEKNRAEKAAEICDQVVHVAFEQCEFVGTPDLIWMNPPYDTANGDRVEIQWIDMVAPLVQPGHQLILTLPELFFIPGGKWESRLRLCMYKNNLQLHRGIYGGNDPVGALKFSEPAFQDFKQYFLVVEKPRYGQATFEPTIPVAGVVGEADVQISLRLDGESSKFEIFAFALEDTTEIESILTEDNITKIFGVPASEVPITPLQPMRDEIMAAIIAGGMFSGIPVNNNKVVRGGITIEQIETKQSIKQEKGSTVEVTITPKMIAHITQLDMTTGEITKVRSDTDPVEFGNEIEIVAKEVAEVLEKENPSFFQADRDLERLAKSFENVHAPRALKGKRNGLFTKQIEAGAVIRRGWELTKVIFLNGQMGTGKTIISIASAVGEVINKKADAQKILILLPPKDDLIEKWKEEIALSCRDLNPKIFDVRTIPEVQKAFANDGLTFILIKETMAKRGGKWEETGYFRNKKGKAVCVRCGERHPFVNKRGDEPRKVKEITYCRNCGAKNITETRDDRGKGNRVAHVRPYMAEYYTQRAWPNFKLAWKDNDEKKRAMQLVEEHCTVFNKGVYGNEGNAYSPIARYIRNHYRGTYVMIADEAHHYKGGDSARGYASFDLIRGARRVLYMTGTIYNGYASSIFFNLFRSKSKFRALHDYDGVTEFVHKVGLQQEVTRTYTAETNTAYGYANKPSTYVKEIPGIHPSMIAEMLPFTVFIKLNDLGFDLPPQHANTLFVSEQKDIVEEITKYLDSIKQEARREMTDEKIKSMSLMSQHTWAKTGAYDCYPEGDSVASSATNASFVLEPIPVEMTRKDEATLRIVQKHKAEGFPTLIYYPQTDRRPIHHRLEKLFQKYGMKMAYMPATTTKRKQFIQSQLDMGVDAILCNANLVREGIDLLMFGAMIWYSDTFDAILVDQANARNHRIGQVYETYVYYLAVNGTSQADTWVKTAQKVQAMQAMHGDIRTGIAALLGDESLINVVQSQLIEDVYEVHDSDMTLDDLPPLEILKPTKKKKVKPSETTYYSIQAWALEKAKEQDIDISRVLKKNTGRKPRAVPEGQVTMFI